MSAKLVSLAALLVLAPIAPAYAAEAESVEALVVKLAQTPEQHRTVAEYYRQRAAGERQEAARHKAMAASYAGGKLAEREQMRMHCDKLVAGHEALAKEYEALAAMHDAEAKKP
jgi:hypothetical protein